MRKNLSKLIYSCLIFISYTGHSQIDHIKLLLGQTDKMVTVYFDSLNHLKSNPYYKVEKSVTKYGDLMLSINLAIDDESFYNCLNVIAVFNRQNGVEYCVRENVSGNVKYSQSNLNFIKDNFKFVSDGKWEYNYPANLKLKVVATFEMVGDNHPLYSLTYDFMETN